MNTAHQLVMFFLDEQRFAVHLAAVERIVRVVDIAPLPGVPAIVVGIINFQGNVIPVFDIRQRFQLPERDIDLSDQMIIACTATRKVAMVVDSVDGVIECSETDINKADNILPGIEYVDGVMKLEDGMVLIHDLDTFLSLKEEKVLEEAMGENERIMNERIGE